MESVFEGLGWRAAVADIDEHGEDVVYSNTCLLGLTCCNACSLNFEVWSCRGYIRQRAASSGGHSPPRWDLLVLR